MSKLAVWTMISIAGVAASIADASQREIAATVGESVQIRVGGAMVDVVAERLDGAVASVVSADAFAPDKHGLVAADFPRMTLTSRVVVETDDMARLRQDSLPAQAQGAGIGVARGAVTVSAHPTVRGFAIVELGSVREALDTADRLRAVGAYTSVEVEMVSPIALRSAPTDPLFIDQWHLRNTQVPSADINADGAWDMGYTGSGVTIGIVEGGFQEQHPDLAPNYSASASTPGSFGPTSHATSCAGIAAARGNNGTGVAGLAYDAFISQQRFGSNSANATAFTFRNDLNDVKSNSWGPFDNGTITVLSSVERAALQQAAELGRGGLGTNIAWAAGNGGLGDRVDYDPYASSRYTLAIGAVGDQDRRSSFNERGSSMLVVAHSSGNNRGTTTTTTGSGYTSSFGGTSSASPLGAAAVALALEANPSLSWRDVQHLLIETARKVDPNDADWEVNGAGKDISYDYGFGAIDAGALVAAAETWVNVAPEVSASSGVNGVNTPVPDNDAAGVVRTTTIDEDITLEAVELIISIDTTYRGDLEILLTAPSGTVSRVSAGGRNDSGNSLVDYIFTSKRHWGESSAGTWTVQVADVASSDNATFVDFEVRVYGTEASPACSIADLASAFGVLDIADIDAFIGAFLANDPGADLTPPFGILDVTDVDAFIGAFIAGCP